MDLKTFISEEPRGAGAKLAHDLEISSSYLSQLASGQAPISPQRAVAIEKATDGKVTRKDLRPDDWHLIWPELAQKESASRTRRSTDRGA